VKYFFDSSVLVPVFLDDHIHHEASFAAFLTASRKNSACAAHTLVEVFSALTRIPAPTRATANEAMLFLELIERQFSFVALETGEYWAVLKECSEIGIVGGTVYDALIARCALKSGADVLYTWNVGDFRRLGPDISKRVRTP
jgi:predicted nucleic acid-binding protein